MRDTIHSIMKDCGIASTCAQIISKGRTTISEAELVEAASKVAHERWPELSPAQAFSRVLTASTEEARVLQHALKIAKAAEFAVFDIKPVVVGGEDARDVDNATAAARAREEIARIGREKFPFLRADQQFARVFEDKNYAALAEQAHRRPAMTTIYETPRATPGNAAYAKSDPAPNADSAYAALMIKAEEYRLGHPSLSIAQCFEKIYTAPANRDLAKRERIESAPR